MIYMEIGGRGLPSGNYTISLIVQNNTPLAETRSRPHQNKNRQLSNQDVYCLEQSLNTKTKEKQNTWSLKRPKKCIVETL